MLTNRTSKCSARTFVILFMTNRIAIGLSLGAYIAEHRAQEKSYSSSNKHHQILVIDAPGKASLIVYVNYRRSIQTTWDALCVFEQFRKSRDRHCAKNNNKILTFQLLGKHLSRRR